MSTNSMESEGERRQLSATLPRGSAPEFGTFMRQVFPETRSSEGAGYGNLTTVRGGGPPPLIRRDYDVAMTLLRRAAESIPALLRHCQQLEADIRRIRAEAAADLHTANGETQQWQQIAVAMKMHIEENEHEIALMRKRLAAAEERLGAGHSLAQQAEQQAHMAMEITTMFHDKIVDSFGVGSPAHAAMDAALRPEEGGRQGR